MEIDSKTFCAKKIAKILFDYLVSTYVVCERLSVMHEPAGVVEILVQILRNTPYSEAPPPPPRKLMFSNFRIV